MSLIRFAQGFKACRTCKVMINVPDRRCPFCGSRLNTIPLRRESSRKIAELKKHPERLAALIDKSRQCRDCNSTKTLTIKRTTGEYPVWRKDGKGNWLCHKCWMNSYRKAQRCSV